MKYDRLRGKTSNMIRVFIPDNSRTDGGGLTGLTNASTNLAIVYIRELDAAATVYTGANIEAQTTLGTFQAPSTSAKCRFKAVDTTNLPGVYELHFHDAATIFGAADASVNVQINVLELTTTALHIGPNMAEIRLIAWDMQTALSATTIGTVTNYTGNTPQTGDNFLRIGAGGAGLTALGDTRIAHLDTDVSSRGTSNYAGGAVASVTGAVGSVTGNVGGNVVGSVASVTADVGITQAGADKVWGSAARSLTTFGTLVADVVAGVWTAGARTLTGFGTLISDLWANVSRTLTQTVGDATAANQMTINTNVLSVNALLVEMNGLIGKNSGMRNAAYSGTNLMSYDLCLYDSSVHALTNDGATGLLHKYAIANTFDGNDNLLTSVTTRVS
jgi:hypothetical protein